MRILKKVLVKSTCSSLSAVLLLTFGVRVANADAISDVLTVSDTLGFSMTMPLMESQEPGKVSIVFPGRVEDLTNPAGTRLSDILSISSFTITLSSDGDTGGGEPPERGPNIKPIVITARSDRNTASGISDTLSVTGHRSKSILEAGEPAEVTISVAARSVPFGAGGDSITISAFTVNLASLADQPGADAGNMTDTITISASSDPFPVPEPSTLTLVALALAGAGARGWISLGERR